MKTVLNTKVNTAEFSLTKLVKLLLIIAPVLLVIFTWLTDDIQTNNLLYNINWKYPQAVLETKTLYLYIHLFTFIPVFLLSFDKRVAYYKNWKYLIPAIILVAIPFIAWDVFFTEHQVWGFNETYVTGLHIFNLPLEECLFFFTVPFACIFIYECLNYYFPSDSLARVDAPITLGLALLFLAVGLTYQHHIYTSTTFLLTSAFLFFHYFNYENTYRSKFYKSYLVALIPFFMVNGVLTGGYTQQPIVIYNPEEYIGLRIISVPLDDSVYGFLMLFLLVTLYEQLKRKTKLHK